MIYTIGYQRLTSRRLEKIVGDLNAILVDCRHRPFSQRPEFGGDRLAEQFGTRYQQRGHTPPRSDFRVMTYQKCDYACHDRTRRQHHKAECCFASSVQAAPKRLVSNTRAASVGALISLSRSSPPF
jgi:hypothetical protein